MTITANDPNDPNLTAEGHKHIGVIGGGVAGLVAAYRLARAGYRVTLWERGQRFGGQAVTFELNGARIEYFYHHLFKSDTSIVALAEELGVGDTLMWLPSNVGYLSGGKIYPFNGALDLLRFSAIPFIDRIRIGLVTLYLQRQADWRPYEKVTAHRWLKRALGARAYDRTLGAQLRAKFGRYTEDIAMVWFWGKIRLRTTSRQSPLEQEKLGYFRGSFDTIINAMVDGARKAGAELHLGKGPEELRQREDGRWEVHFGEGDPAVCDAIVATVPSPIFSRMVPALPADYRSRLSGLDYESAVVMVLEMDRKLTDIYWLNVADDDVPFTGVIEHTNFLPASDYGGSHVVYLSRYLEPDHPAWTTPDDELFAEYIPYLKRLNPDFDPAWVKNRWVFRERAAQPVITMNYSERIPARRTPLAGLYLANTTQIYPEDRGTNYSVRLGNEIAAQVAGDLAP
ncbi:MAG TPA: NAD(P)/FAD-dependent oxidoreductase [Thermomicrobiales bacterium]|jgi:protoporphyrinogen oxidase|nr:NAD(P)/FAD-dependent oxidoreductase [Thermomicrobiales bacterium]